jgi:hypothetical protein
MPSLPQIKLRIVPPASVLYAIVINHRHCLAISMTIPSFVKDSAIKTAVAQVLNSQITGSCRG